MLPAEIVEEIVDLASPIEVSGKYIIENNIVLFRLEIKIRSLYIKKDLQKNFTLGWTDVRCKYMTKIMDTRYYTNKSILEYLELNKDKIKLNNGWYVSGNNLVIIGSGISIPLDKHKIKIDKYLDELREYVEQLLERMEDSEEGKYNNELYKLRKRRRKYLSELREEEDRILKRIKNEKILI